jgi:NAD(P)-dependent dehydrogenase (short-subunit alcohol dehydrogenase family)
MGRVALVTGASSGLGRVMALALLEAGHRVVLSATDAAALEDTRQASRAGDRAAVITADLSRQSEVPALAQAAEAAFGQIDILVNNAGVSGTPARQPHEAELPEMRRVFEINTFAPIQLTQLLLPGMIRRRWGRIVLISTSLDTMLRFVPYGPSKAAAEAFIAALSTSLQSTGVTANVLVPGGMTATRMTRHGGDPATMLPPEIMVPPIVWLASDASDHVGGRRFIAARWNATLSGEQAAQAAGSPIAWSGLSDRAISPRGGAAGR